jgi:ABC-type uncharacterized transport system auxiliary subunit
VRSLLKTSRWLAVLAGLLAGCSSPPETRYYTLRGDKPLDGKPAPAAAPTVLLDRFTIDDAYADERIAYRREGHELGFDPYSRWAGAPAAQVEDAVRELLRASGLFGAVRQPQPLGDGRSSYDLVVTGRVGRLEEVDASDDEWLGALDLDLYLLDGKSRAVLAERHFAKSARAEKRNPREVAAAISSLLAEAVGDFVAGVKPLVAARPR